MEFKKNAKIETDNLWDDIFNERFKMEELLKNKKDVDSVLLAMSVLRNFEQSAESQDILQYY
jgi:hypothetical protein